MTITFEHVEPNWIIVRVPGMDLLELTGWDDGVWTATLRYPSGAVYRYRDYPSLFEAMKDIRERWIPSETRKG